MDEFKRVHRKMFAHNAVTEDDGSTRFHSEETRLKISHTTEVSHTFLILQTKLDFVTFIIAHQLLMIVQPIHHNHLFPQQDYCINTVTNNTCNSLNFSSFTVQSEGESYYFLV